jgi:hypothetical protein
MLRFLPRAFAHGGSGDDDENGGSSSWGNSDIAGNRSNPLERPPPHWLPWHVVVITGRGPAFAGRRAAAAAGLAALGLAASAWVDGVTLEDVLDPSSPLFSSHPCPPIPSRFPPFSLLSLSLTIRISPPLSLTIRISPPTHTRVRARECAALHLQ